MNNPNHKTDATEFPTDTLSHELDLSADNLFDDADDFFVKSDNHDARSSDDILNAYSVDASTLDEMEEIDADILMGEMADIEAELQALREQLEAETIHHDNENKEEIFTEETLSTPEPEPEIVAEPVVSEPIAEAEPETTHEPEMDSFAAFAAELFEAADSGDYGVNSQRFKPDEFDVASSTSEIAPTQLDEDDLEIIDGSDLEALFGLSDDYTPAVGSSNGFLADAAQLEEQDNLPTLLPSSEEFILEENQAAHHHDNVIVDDEPELNAQVNVFFDNLTVDVEEIDLTENNHIDTQIDTKIDTKEEIITLDDEPAPQTVQAASPAALQSVGLDLSDDSDDPMAWLDKMKNEMASKFDVNLDQEAAALSQADLSHLYDDLEEFDDQKANLGENLNQLPEFDESSLNQATTPNRATSDDVISVTDLDDIMTFDEEPVVAKRPATHMPVLGKSIEEVLNLKTPEPEVVREINTNVSLDDIWADNKPSTIGNLDLTADPLDESELEVFDESILFGDSTPKPQNHEEIDLEMDFGVKTQPESASDTQSIDLFDDVIETQTLDLSDNPIVETHHANNTQVETQQIDIEQIDLNQETQITKHSEEVVTEEIFDTEVDFNTIVAELPAESLAEVSTDLSDLERVAAEITDMEDFVPPKTKLMELMEAEQAAEKWDGVNITVDEVANVGVSAVQELELDLGQADAGSNAISVDEAVALVEPALPTESEPQHSVLESITETVSEWEHDAEEWAQGMAHVAKEKAEEWAMRGEILAHEVGDALKHAEEWVEDLTDTLADKVEELEMRAEILVHDVVDNAKEILHLSESEKEILADADEISLDELDAMLQEDATETIRQPETTEIIETSENIEQIAEIQTEQVALNDTVAEVGAVAAGAMVASRALSSEELEADKRGWASRLKAGLTKSRNQMAKSLAGVFGGGKIDEDLYEELETTLLISDMGIEATEQLMKEVRNRVSLKGLKDGAELRAALKDAVYDLLKPLEKPLEIPNNGQPFVIMMAGINGAGKTTSIGKLAKYFQAQGKSVMLAAGDTFRAAAREQLQEWGARNGVTVISQASGDSAAVCFDAVESAKAKGIDIVLADTAGRLPTQLHLMEEIKKVKRVLQKAMPDAPHEIMVVLDANIGQNAINQVVAFDDALGVTGLIVTKLDGTAKGGVLAALASSRPIPVRYIGVGEGIDDLRPFDACAFVDALLDE